MTLYLLNDLGRHHLQALARGQDLASLVLRMARRGLYERHGENLSAAARGDLRIEGAILRFWADEEWASCDPQAVFPGAPDPKMLPAILSLNPPTPAEWHCLEELESKGEAQFGPAAVMLMTLELVHVRSDGGMTLTEAGSAVLDLRRLLRQEGRDLVEQEWHPFAEPSLSSSTEEPGL